MEEAIFLKFFLLRHKSLQLGPVNCDRTGPCEANVPAGSQSNQCMTVNASLCMDVNISVLNIYKLYATVRSHVASKFHTQNGGFKPAKFKTPFTLIYHRNLSK